MEYFWFIVCAYLTTIVMLGGLIGWVILDGYHSVRHMRRLEEEAAEDRTVR